LFFLDVLRAEGIPLPASAYFPVIRTDKNQGMFVKTWSEPKGNAPYVNVYTTLVHPFTFNPATGWNYTWLNQAGIATPAMTKLPGVKGQGNANPLAFFRDHAVTELTINGVSTLFDPSYGTVVTGNSEDELLLKLQNASLDYISTDTTRV